MDSPELLEAIRKLTSAIDNLSSSTGLGSRRNSAGKTGGVNRSPVNPIDEASKKMSASQRRIFDAMTKQIQAVQSAGGKLTKTQQEFLRAMNADTQAVGKNTSVRKELTEAERKAKYELEELARANKSAVKSTGEFAKNLLVGGADLKSSIGSLGNSLGYAASKGNKLAGIFATIAGGTAFALSSMEAFAKNAAAVADSVDLGAVNAGFITSRQLFSSLGQSFNKVLNESSNSFKIFGSTTEDAINNLAKLSNGLRTGSVSTAITNRLGKDSAKQFKEAAKATANLGLTQEEQASLQASIMQQVRLTAKNEVDAQKMLVKQYSETVTSARNLSNSFGVGAKAILKAIENFNKSASGKTAQRLNVKGATDALAMLQSANFDLSEDQMQKMAVDIARGRAGDAATMVADDPNAYNFVIAMGESFKEAERNGGVNDKTLREAMLRRQDQVLGGAVGAGADGTGLGLTTGGKMAESYENLNDFYKRLQEGGKKAEDDKKKKEDSGKTSEADNIKNMNVLTAALDSLKGAVNSLISAIYANTGAIGLLIASIAGAALIGAITKGVLKGVAGGAGTAFGKLAEKIGIGRTVGAVGTAGSAATSTAAGAAAGGGVLASAKAMATNVLKGPVGTALIAAAGGFAIDAALGAAGVGSGEVDKKQDDANWSNMSALEKFQSGTARLVESAGRLFFLDNLSNEAAAERIKNETKYLNDKSAKEDQLKKQQTTKAEPAKENKDKIKPNVDIDTSPLTSVDMHFKTVVDLLARIAQNTASLTNLNIAAQQTKQPAQTSVNSNIVDSLNALNTSFRYSADQTKIDYDNLKNTFTGSAKKLESSIPNQITVKQEKQTNFKVSEMKFAINDKENFQKYQDFKLSKQEEIYKKIKKEQLAQYPKNANSPILDEQARDTAAIMAKQQAVEQFKDSMVKAGALTEFKKQDTLKIDSNKLPATVKDAPSTALKPADAEAINKQQETTKQQLDLSSNDLAKVANDNQALTTVIGYLSQIQNDIAAIRGNTRPDNSATAPVRLG